jgi:hypothetical protein
MAGNNVTIRLDTTPPSGVAVALDNGASFTSDDLVDVNITFDAPTDEANTSLWQMLIWSADIDETYDAKVKATEATSGWITYQNPYQVRFAGTDGPKTVSIRLRDEVNNSSGISTATITMDTTKPIVTVTNADVGRISENEGKNLAHFSFTCDVAFVEYQVRVVGTAGDNHLSGTLIPVTAGSVNTSGTGTFSTATEPIPVTIHGTDLRTASTGDGPKIIKVFCRDDAGNWSA